MGPFWISILSSLALAAAGAATAASHAALTATATFQDVNGREVGSAELTQTPNGVLLKGSFVGLEPGTHALHIHETGRCEPPFTSAGGHFAPLDSQHGLKDEERPHAGDLLNIHAETSGDVRFEMLNPRISLKQGETSIFDADGSAFIVHSGPDDHHTDPAGDAGDRIACAVIERSGSAEAADASATEPTAAAMQEQGATEGGQAEKSPARASETAAVSTPSPEQSSAKTLDAADTVEVIAVDADARTLTVESSPVSGALPERTVYDVDESTVIRAGAETLKLAALEPGARVVVAVDLEPEVEPGAGEPDRNILAREVQLAIRADGSRATGGAGAE